MDKIKIIIGPDKNGLPMLKKIIPRESSPDPHWVPVDQYDADINAGANQFSRIIWAIQPTFNYYFGESAANIAGRYIKVTKLGGPNPNVDPYVGAVPANLTEAVWKEIPSANLTQKKVGIDIWNQHVESYDVPWKYTLTLWPSANGTGTPFYLDPMITNRR